MNKPQLVLLDFYGTLGYSEEIDSRTFISFLTQKGVPLKSNEDLKSFQQWFSYLLGFAEDWNNLTERLLEEFAPKTEVENKRSIAKFLEENFVFRLYKDANQIFRLPFKKAVLTSNAKFLIEDLLPSVEIFTPKETNFLKPDHKAFLAPLKKFNLSPQQVVMVGDKIEKDIIPAEKLGMRGILIDRENYYKDSGREKITSLEELNEIL